MLHVGKWEIAEVNKVSSVLTKVGIVVHDYNTPRKCEAYIPTLHITDRKKKM